MGNVYAIYDVRCLNYQFEEAKFCPVYKEHLENVQFINQLGVIFEKLVYQNYGIPNLPKGSRLSWYQLMGQALKRGGHLMPESDRYRKYISTTGKGEKLIGQMEDEFSIVCNHLLLHPIQEIRCYCQTNVECLHNLFLTRHMEIKTLEGNLSSISISHPEYSSMMSTLEDKRNDFKSLHDQLHKDIIYVYENILNLKLKVPTVLEHQLQVNLYSIDYLDFLVHLFKEDKVIRKQIVPLKDYTKSFESYIPDYRPMLYKHQSLEEKQAKRSISESASMVKDHSRKDDDVSSHKLVSKRSRSEGKKPPKSQESSSRKQTGDSSRKMTSEKGKTSQPQGSQKKLKELRTERQRKIKEGTRKEVQIDSSRKTPLSRSKEEPKLPSERNAPPVYTETSLQSVETPYKDENTDVQNEVSVISEDVKPKSEVKEPEVVQKQKGCGKKANKKIVLTTPEPKGSIKSSPNLESKDQSMRDPKYPNQSSEPKGTDDAKAPKVAQKQSGCGKKRTQKIAGLTSAERNEQDPNGKLNVDGENIVKSEIDKENQNLKDSKGAEVAKKGRGCGKKKTENLKDQKSPDQKDQDLGQDPENPDNKNEDKSIKGSTSPEVTKKQKGCGKKKTENLKDPKSPDQKNQVLGQDPENPDIKNEDKNIKGSTSPEVTKKQKGCGKKKATKLPEEKTAEVPNDEIINAEGQTTVNEEDVK